MLTVNTSFLSDELEEMFISHVVSGYLISGGLVSVGRCQVVRLSEKFANPLIPVPAHVRTCPKPLCEITRTTVVIRIDKITLQKDLRKNRCI